MVLNAAAERAFFVDCQPGNFGDLAEIRAERS
jgi:hypothetical protein